MRLLKSCKHLLVAATMVVLCLPSLALDPDQLEQLSDTHFQQPGQNNLANAVVIVAYQGDTLFARGYGLANPTNGMVVSPTDSLFRIGSTSKLFTWLAVMQLVESGLLDLETDIGAYLDFELNDTLVLGPDDLDPGTVTLTHLMTHTAGFEDYPDTLFRLDPDQHLSLSNYVKRHQPQRLYPAGAVTAYSNYSSALAGYIVERISGQPFEEYVREHILRPLGMHRSFFEQPVPRAFQTRLVVPARYHQGEWLTGQFEYMPIAAGAMSTTAEDMSRFMLAMLEPERLEAAGVLKATTARALRKRQFSQDDALGGMAHGWMEAEVNGERVLFHGGGTLLFDTGLYLLPERHTGVFVSYSGGNYLTHVHFFQALMDAFYPAPAGPADLPLPDSGAAERAQALVGEYHQNRRSVTSSEKLVSLMMGPLLIETDEQGDLRLHQGGTVLHYREIEPGRYRNLEGDRFRDYFGTLDTLVFSKDPHGRALLAAGGPMTYIKAPWYETLTFNAVSIGLTTLFMLLSVVFFVSRGLWRLIQKDRRSQTQRCLSFLTGSFAFGWLLLLASILVTGAPDPLYQLPAAAFDPEPWFDHLIWIPRALVGLGLIWLLGHALLARKAALSISALLHTWFFGGFVVFVIAWLWHWNLI